MVLQFTPGGSPPSDCGHVGVCTCTPSHHPKARHIAPSFTVNVRCMMKRASDVGAVFSHYEIHYPQGPLIRAETAHGALRQLADFVETNWPQEEDTK